VTRQRLNAPRRGLPHDPGAAHVLKHAGKDFTVANRAQAAGVHAVVYDSTIQWAEIVKGLPHLIGNGDIDERRQEDVTNPRTVGGGHWSGVDGHRSCNAVAHQGDVTGLLSRRPNREHGRGAFGPRVRSW
jgi:hypothetical protein